MGRCGSQIPQQANIVCRQHRKSARPIAQAVNALRVGTNPIRVNLQFAVHRSLAVGYQVGIEGASLTARRRRLAALGRRLPPENSIGETNHFVRRCVAMREDFADARRLTWLRKLFRAQQERIERQRDLIARLESETPNVARLRAAREALRQMIESHDATLREAAAAQEGVDLHVRANR